MNVPEIQLTPQEECRAFIKKVFGDFDWVEQYEHKTKSFSGTLEFYCPLLGIGLNPSKDDEAYRKEWFNVCIFLASYGNGDHMILKAQFFPFIHPSHQNELEKYWTSEDVLVGPPAKLLVCIEEYLEAKES